MDDTEAGSWEYPLMDYTEAGSWEFRKTAVIEHATGNTVVVIR
jgi:hypothetical protein